MIPDAMGCTNGNADDGDRHRNANPQSEDSTIDCSLCLPGAAVSGCKCVAGNEVPGCLP